MNAIKRLSMSTRVIFGVSTLLIFLALSFFIMYAQLAVFFPFFNQYIQIGLLNNFYLTNLIVNFIVVIFLTFLYQCFLKIVTILCLWFKSKL